MQKWPISITDASTFISKHIDSKENRNNANAVGYPSVVDQVV